MERTLARPAIQSPAQSVATVLVELAESWEKHNPRNDAKAWSWFRFQNDFFDDPDVFDLPGCQKLLLIYLFTRRNKGAKPVFPVKIKHAARCSSCTEDEIREGLAALVALGKIIVHDGVRERTDPNVDVRERTDPFPTDVRTVRDGTDETVERSAKALRMSAAGRRPPLPEELLKLWNQGKAPGQPGAEAVAPGTKRWRMTKARLTAKPELEYWREVVARVAKSAFCRGEVDKRDGAAPWVANFDWLVRPDTHAKVLEGQYDDADPEARKSAKRKAEDEQLRRYIEADIARRAAEK
jgi:hypothetical protein